MKCSQDGEKGHISPLNFNLPAIRLLQWRDGIVVRASALQSVDLGFIAEVESYQKTFKNDIHSFPAWRSA